jgi:arylsulfatase A
MATIASLVGYALPDDAAEDSHDLLPLLRGEADQSGRETVVHRTWGLPWGIRHGDWLYINAASGSVSREPDWLGYDPNPHDAILNHLGRDPEQERNLVIEQAEKAAELRALLQQIRDRGHSAPRLMP